MQTTDARQRVAWRHVALRQGASDALKSREATSISATVTVQVSGETDRVFDAIEAHCGSIFSQTRRVQSLAQQEPH